MITLTFFKFKTNLGNVIFCIEIGKNNIFLWTLALDDLFPFPYISPNSANKQRITNSYP